MSKGGSSHRFLELASAVAPFSSLDAAELEALAGKVREVRYRRGEAILAQGGPASEHLMLLSSGRVQVSVRPGPGEEVVIDHREAGELFGLLSLVSADRSRANVSAVEDTGVFLIDRATVRDLMCRSADFAEALFRAVVGRHLDRTMAELPARTLLPGTGERLLYTTTVGELAARRTVTAPADLAIRDAARLMTEQRVSSIVLLGPGGEPAGIVTDRDLRDKVVTDGRDTGDGISSIMTRGLISVEARDYCFEALLKMLRHNIHHLLVLEEGRLRGVVTNHDLMILQGTSPLYLARDIESCRSVGEIARAAGKMQGLVSLLLAEGARASSITRIVTEINDRMLRRIVQFAESEAGPAPLPWCWIVFGSEGRREQTFKTDQDNALILADAPGAELGETAARWAGRFARSVNDALVEVGFPPCPGGYMASNETWRRPLAAWREYFAGWMATPTPEAVLAAVILFDFRPAAGATELGAGLRELLVREAPRHSIFLRHLADLAVRVRPPLGFFRNFVTERGGEHPGTINIKFRCLAPLVNIVRLWALESGVPESSTLDRVATLRERHQAATEFADEIVHAFELLNLLRIRHQFGQIREGRTPDNQVDPERLTAPDRNGLRDACQLIGRLQDAVSRQYNPGVRL